MAEDKTTKEGVLGPNTWANFAVILGVLVSIFTGVQYSVTKINEHNALMSRVAQLETQEIEIQTIRSSVLELSFKGGQTEDTVSKTVLKVDSLTQQMVDIRIRLEHVLAIMDRGK